MLPNLNSKTQARYLLQVSRFVLRASVCTLAYTGLATAHAAITVYTDQGLFMAAVVASAVDTFDDLPQAEGLGLGVALNRTVGAYGYLAAATSGGQSDQFYNSGAGSDTWLSSNEPDAVITLNGFTANTQAVGGFWFGTGPDGSFVTGEPLALVVTDSSGFSLTRNFNATSTQSFLGFVSDVRISTLQLNSVNPLLVWPTINNLVLAQAAPVPEAASSVMMLLGLATLVLGVRRRCS
jgi:hypothetical protein